MSKTLDVVEDYENKIFDLESRIAELEAKISRMANCFNCKDEGSACMHKITAWVCSDWEAKI